jgi:hypothetical protein
MEVISPSRQGQPRSSVVPILASGTVGTVLIISGLGFAYVLFATPALGLLLPGGRPDTMQLVLGMAIWAVALIAPAACILLGTNRLARMLARVRGRAPHRTPTAKALAGLSDDVVVASGVLLPDGRGVPDLIVGSFGAAVVRELPPPDALRISNGQWQLRLSRGWMTIEDPLAKTVRDSERVRRWLAHDDADFVVKVYAAVITRDLSVPRSAACAVVTVDQLAAWIQALPPQRSITAGRREQMIERVREATV